MFCFLNGNIVSSETPLIHINDRGFLLGDGLFETIKYSDGKIFFFKEHFERLLTSAEFLKIPLKYVQEKLKNICNELIVRNYLKQGDVSIRITLTRGIASRGIALPKEPQPTLLITTTAYTYNQCFPKAFITNIKRNEFSPLTQLKTTQYMESILAKQQAIEHGYDEGIMLNTQGEITETSIGNLFLIINEEIITPNLEAGILPGITRKKVIEICEELGLTIKQKRIRIDEITQAAEAFQTNSLLEIQALSCINDYKLRYGPQDSITSEIMNTYSKKKYTVNDYD